LKSLEEYLRENFSKGIIDHAIRANIDSKDIVSFYIHPAGHNGDTLDYIVKRDNIARLNYSNAIITVECEQCGKQYEVVPGAHIPICHEKYMHEKAVI